jgi:hypothetical protein
MNFTKADTTSCAHSPFDSVYLLCSVCFRRFGTALESVIYGAHIRTLHISLGSSLLMRNGAPTALPFPFVQAWHIKKVSPPSFLFDQWIDRQFRQFIFAPSSACLDSNQRSWLTACSHKTEEEKMMSSRIKKHVRKCTRKYPSHRNAVRMMMW